VAVDKGAIDDGHVLVLPIEHFPNSLGVPASTYAEMDRYLSALQSCYAAQASAVSGSPLGNVVSTVHPVSVACRRDHGCALAQQCAMQLFSASKRQYAKRVLLLPPQGKEAVAFERFMAFRKSGGNHCHINVVPVPASAAATARAAFDKAAAAIGAAFTELPSSTGEVCC
jgi:Protein similar to CwfJ C-terminus 1